MATENHAAASPESAAAVTKDASVALDIGEGYGALIIYPDERYRNREIEISPLDGHGHRVHTGVHERATFSGASQLTAVFGSLPSGEYIVWLTDDLAGPTVSIPEGAVAELRLS